MSERVPALIWCPFGDEPSAARVAEMLLDEGLINCANIMPAMRSLYVWRGVRGEDRETGVLFKTDSQRLDKAVARLEALHPYDTPAVLGWRCDVASPATAEWLCGGASS